MSVRSYFTVHFRLQCVALVTGTSPENAKARGREPSLYTDQCGWGNIPAELGTTGNQSSCGAGNQETKASHWLQSLFEGKWRDILL